jgi:hypothetical protein
MLYFLVIVERLIVEQQFSGKPHADSLDFCLSDEDIGGILAAAVNSELAQMFSSLNGPDRA